MFFITLTELKATVKMKKNNSNGDSEEGRATAKEQAEEMPQSEIIFLIFYIYMDIHTFCVF